MTTGLPDPEDSVGGAVKPPSLGLVRVPEPSDPALVVPGVDDPDPAEPAPVWGGRTDDVPGAPLSAEPGDGVTVEVLAAAFVVSPKANIDPPTVPTTASAATAWVARRRSRRPLCDEAMMSSFQCRCPPADCELDLPPWCRTVLGGLCESRGRLACMTQTRPAIPAPAVLLVEDDRQLADMLTTLLVEEGYHVDVAEGGQAGLHLGLTRSYAVLVIDRGLPVLEGLELLRTLRSNGSATPALVLTARGSLTDRVEGLDAGAEDYLVKPFEVPELLARIRALLRRHADTAQFLPLGRRRLSLTDRAVVSGDHDDNVHRNGHVALSERECSLLAVLAASPEQVFTRPQLLARVFDQADTVGTVDTYVHYLRRKLGRETIQTVRGLGYRLGSS